MSKYRVAVRPCNYDELVDVVIERRLLFFWKRVWHVTVVNPSVQKLSDTVAVANSIMRTFS